MDRARYFDNAATTPVDERVLDSMLPYFREQFGNANSIHGLGARAMDAVERAREQVARLVGAEDPSQIFFTSGATESNNWIVRSHRNGVCSPFEHPSLIEPAQSVGWRIWEHEGPGLINSGVAAVASLMAVNNETGDIWDIREQSVGGALLHADATQALGKLPFTVQGLAYASMSAHKIYGPKGVGALYSEASPPPAILEGGGQEHGFRSGTLNVPGIVGFGAAADLAWELQAEDAARAKVLKELFLAELRTLSDWETIGGPKTSPFIVAVGIRGVEGETLVIEADRKRFAVSSGAACSSSSTEPSHVLVAMGVDPELIRGTVRISFGRWNTPEETAALARTLAQSAEMLRTMTGEHNSAQRRAGV